MFNLSSTRLSVEIEEQEYEEVGEEEDVYVLTDEWAEFFAKSEAKRQLGRNHFLSLNFLFYFTYLARVIPLPLFSSLVNITETFICRAERKKRKNQKTEASD